MKQIFLGLPFGLFSFVAAGLVVAGFIGPGIISFIAACAAGWSVFNYFRLEDAADLARRLQGHEKVWSLPYPTAYGVIKDTLARCKMFLPGSGPCHWSIQTEDDQEGIITALITLNEQPARNVTILANVAVTFRLAPVGDRTHVVWSYQAFAPGGHYRVKQAIDLLDQSLAGVVQQQAQAQQPQLATV